MGRKDTSIGRKPVQARSAKKDTNCTRNHTDHSPITEKATGDLEE